MNWHERIAHAEKNGGFTDEEVFLAGNWVSCACGEQDPRIPRGGEGRQENEPDDPCLSVQGLEFSKAVSSDNYNRARAALFAIEARATELLNAPARETGTQ